MRSTLISELGEVHYPAWGDMMHSLRTGQRAFDHVFGTDAWTYFQTHEEVGRVFHQNMMNLTKALDQAILAAYDFSPFTKVLDVGGGHGGLVAAILRKHPNVRGVVFDVPNVAAGAKEHLASVNVADRCDVTSGDFFQAIPVTGADACKMKFILHDWTDEQSTTILRNLHRALPGGARLLLLEMVIPPRNEHSFGHFMDLNMLVMTGGRECTAEEFRQLLKQGGFEMQRVVPTDSPLSIVEARRV
jgi:ubiquinone/menaquinone biosynthesis C-methylase UbiE